MRTTVIVGTVGFALILVAVVLLTGRRTLPAQFGAAAAAASSPASADGTAAASPATSDSASPGAADTPTSAPAPRAAVVVTDPSSVRLAAFQVTAPVVPVTSHAGILDPPDDPAQVGWWLASAPPGVTAGATVLVGHVDGPDGPGAFYRLVHARPGDTITVAGSNGNYISYRVARLQYVAKVNQLPPSLFDQTGPPRLVLISCGGSFDRATDQYADNVVVTALRS